MSPTGQRMGRLMCCLSQQVLDLGVIAGGSVRTLLEAAGVQNIVAKQLGSNNLLNNARATICALQALKTVKIKFSKLVI